MMRIRGMLPKWRGCHDFGSGMIGCVSIPGDRDAPGRDDAYQLVLPRVAWVLKTWFGHERRVELSRVSCVSWPW
eukprot:512189-Heterocapsa_arctica.AAC.1